MANDAAVKIIVVSMVAFIITVRLIVNLLLHKLHRVNSNRHQVLPLPRSSPGQAKPQHRDNARWRIVRLRDAPRRRWRELQSNSGLENSEFRSSREGRAIFPLLLAAAEVGSHRGRSVRSQFHD